MTAEAIKSHSRSGWRAFWENLKEGYDWFEEKRQPPNVVVRNGVYTFEDWNERVSE